MLKSLNIGTSPESRRNTKRSIGKFVPVLKWLPKYTRMQSVSDLVAGITLGLTMIPQSIAYAALAGLSAQYGLYSSFLGVFIYVFFGTVREVSIGPTSLMALLTLEYTRDMPVEFVILLCFLAGCVELLMGLLNLGFIVDFISIPVTSGFTSATSVIIIISQLQGLLGLRYKSSNIVDNLTKIFNKIGNARYGDLTLGICCIVCLLILRKLKDINCRPSAKKILWFLSIGRNALVVLITSAIAFHLDSHGSSPFILSGKVESGLPKVSLPPFSAHVGNETYSFFDMLSHYGSGVFVVPLIAVLANVAIAKAFASGTSVNASQEMLTLGLCNIFGSFVSSMPTCGAFTRCAVSSASGIQTPMAGLYSGFMTLLALSFLTPYFYFIPRSTLAAVLISAVVFMVDWHIIKILWTGCRRDAIAAVVTFFVCVTFSVEIGLLGGAFLNLAFLLNSSVRPKLDVMHYKTTFNKKYAVIKPDTSLYYASVDYLYENITNIVDQIEEEEYLIIDCDRVITIDYTVAKGLFEKLSKEMNKSFNKLWLLRVSPDVRNCLQILCDDTCLRFIEHNKKLDETLEADNSVEGSLSMKSADNNDNEHLNKQKIEAYVHNTPRMESRGLLPKGEQNIAETKLMIPENTTPQ